MTEPTIASFTRVQHSLITHTQARELLTEHQIKRRLRVGTFEPVRVGVYRLGGAPSDWPQDLHAACLAAGPDARASFRAAAALFELPGFPPSTLEITVRRRRVRLDGVTVHDSRFDGPGHRDLVDHIPVTSVARTLCDLTAVATLGEVARAGDDALRRNLVTLRQWAAIARRLQTRGRRRSTVTRTLVEERLTGQQPGESAPEARIARVLVRAGLPRPAHQHRVQVDGRRYRVDLAYPELMIAIEYDSWSFHAQRSAFDRDRARGNDLELLGWCVLRFTSKSTDREIVRNVETALLAAGVARAS